MKDSFDHIWELLAPKAEYANRKRACYTLWLGIPMDERRKIYAHINRKLKNGQYVDFNPFFAISKAAAAVKFPEHKTPPPEDIFLHGRPLFDALNDHIPLVQVDIPDLPGYPPVDYHPDDYPIVLTDDEFLPEHHEE